MSEAPLRDCPVCEGAVRRVINSVGIVFKGSGFYITDNRNGTGKAVNSNLNGQVANDAHKNGTDGEMAKVDASRSDASKSDAPKESSSPTAAKAAKAESAAAATPAST